MFKRTALCLLLPACLLSACSDQPAPEEDLAMPAAPASIEPAPVKKAVLPVRKTVFATVDACLEAGYAMGQCTRAEGTARMMYQIDAPGFKNLNDCHRSFAVCAPLAGTGTEAMRIAPRMEGFSMGDEVPGQLQQLSAEHPASYAPIYLTREKKWVYLIVDQKGVAYSKPVSDEIHPDPTTEVPPKEIQRVIRQVGDQADARVYPGGVPPQETPLRRDRRTGKPLSER